MAGWPSNEPSVQPELTPEQIIANRDAAIQDWLDRRAKLVEIKETEMVARTGVAKMLFPNPSKGTQRFPLGGGYAIKLVHKLNYTLGDANKVNGEGGKVSRADQVFELEAKMAALGEVACVLTDRLIKWTPELSVTEYDKLDLSDPVQLQLRNLIDGILTVAPAAPALEFEEPKVK